MSKTISWRLEGEVQLSVLLLIMMKIDGRLWKLIP